MVLFMLNVLSRMISEVYILQYFLFMSHAFHNCDIISFIIFSEPWELELNRMNSILGGDGKITE